MITQRGYRALESRAIESREIELLERELDSIFGIPEMMRSGEPQQFRARRDLHPEIPKKP
ncbi:MAG: hypothetical protein AAB590_01990 [Patescibacteria group bacterium]